MKETEELKYLKSIIGKIALMDERLVKVVKIEEWTNTKQHGGLFQKKTYTEHRDAKYVWWKVVGDESGETKSFGNSRWYNWEKMISDAAIVINQSKILLDKEKINS